MNMTPNTTLAQYARDCQTLGDLVTVTLPDGRTFKAYVMSAWAKYEGIQTITLGYGGVASEQYQADLQQRKREQDEIGA